jgi:hypothetical protein
MKLWKVWSVFGAGAATLAAGLAYQAGCSSTPAATPGQPPPPPSSGTATTDVKTFAINSLMLGEADRSGGAPSNSAWKSYGYNLDGLTTTKDSADVCTLAAGAPKTNQVDGNNGIDNSFGSVILPIIQSAASLPTPSQTITQSIDGGSFTIQLKITGLSSDAKQNATGLKGELFASGSYGGTPAFDANTDWPVEPALLNDPADISKGSKIAFNNAYVNNGTFVSGDLSAGGVTVSISLVFQGVALTLSVNHAVITFDHTSDADAANGTIAGVINTQELITGLKSVAGRISSSLCGSAFDGIAQQIQQASDILSDGTNASGKNCDGISIGLGFTGKLIHDPTKIATSDASVPPDPCAAPGDAGTDTGTTTDAGGGDATTD